MLRARDAYDPYVAHGAIRKHLDQPPVTRRCTGCSNAMQVRQSPARGGAAAQRAAGSRFETC
eukprot:6686244-Prymnesium_polylepis.2